MPNHSLGSIADYAWQGLNDVPTAISGAVMQQLGSQAMFFVNNYLKTSLTPTTIDDSYVGVMTNLVKAWTLARMADVGAQFNWHLGDFSVNKGGAGNTEATQVQQFFDMAMMELKSIGKPLRFSKANG